MKKFNSLFCLGLILLTTPIFICFIVFFVSSRPANIQEPAVFKVAIVETKIPKIITDTIKEIKLIKLSKKKKFDASDSIKSVIRKDTLIQKDTLISK